MTQSASTPDDSAPLPGDDHPEARARTIDNLKRIGLAMGGYAHANDGRFPPAALYKDGKPLLSWRVAVLPFLHVYRGARLYQKFRLDEPWDSPHNDALLEEMPPEYASVVGNEPARHSTYYQGVVGLGALFDGEEGTRTEDITDGLGWTLMVVEAAEPVPWTKPEDLAFDPEKPLSNVGGLVDGGFCVGFADGAARFIKLPVDPGILKSLITINGGEKVSADQF